MIYIRCVIFNCSWRISEGAKAALSVDLRLLWYIIIAMLKKQKSVHKQTPVE